MLLPLFPRMEFYREGGAKKHLRDITGILKISGVAVDWEYISRWAQLLGLTDTWEAVLKRLDE
jgi:hypothetical protein